MRILLAGGGTAGHINPAVAIAKYAQSVEKDTEILFIGKKGGMESRLVPSEGFDIRFIEVEGLKRKISLSNLAAAVKLVGAVGKCSRIIKEFKPDVVVGTGGYVCAPAVIAANKKKIPTLIHEQNVFPGSAIKMLSKNSSVTAISFLESKRYLSGAKNIVFTGNPVRPGIIQGDYFSAREELGIGEEKFILAFGGSLGAKKINDVITDYIEKINGREGIRLCFATGLNNYDAVADELKSRGIKLKDNIQIVKYIDNMDVVMNAADLVIARSGAITISELCVLGKPSVLVPSPNVTNNHQEFNARALSETDAAFMILEKDFNVSSLESAVDKIINDTRLCGKMQSNAKKLGTANATELIYNELLKLL